MPYDQCVPVDDMYMWRVDCSDTVGIPIVDLYLEYQVYSTQTTTVPPAVYSCRSTVPVLVADSAWDSDA